MAQARAARMRAPAPKSGSRGSLGGARASRTPFGAGLQSAAPSPQAETNDVDAVLDLQETVGNRAVVQLLAGRAGAAGTATPPPRAFPGGGNRALAAALAPRLAVIQREMAIDADPKLRVQMLRDAIRIDPMNNRFIIDLGKTSEALTNLTRDGGRAVMREYQAQMSWNLGWILSATQPFFGEMPATNNLKQEDRTRLQYMLLGTIDKKAEPIAEVPAATPPVPAAAPATPAAGPAPSAGPSPAPASAGTPGPAPVDKDNERIAENRLRVTAAEMKIAIGKKDVNKAISLIPKTETERNDLNTVYEALYGQTAYMALFTKLKGKDGQRAAAAWVGEHVEADRLALEAAEERRAAAEKEAAELEALKMPALKPLVKEKRQAAKQKIEAEVKRVVQVGDQTTAAGRAAGREHLKKVVSTGDPKGELAKKLGIGSDAITKAIAEGDEPGELGARLARSDEASDVSSAQVEAVLRDLRQLALDAAERTVDAQPELLGNVVEHVEKMFVDGYFDRFVAAFDANQKRRKFDQVVAGRGGSEEKAAKFVGLSVDEFRAAAGVSADVARNRELLAKQGKLEEWQELYYALTRDPKDFERARSILGARTYTQVQELAKAYAKGTNNKRSLEADIAGTPVEAAYAEFFRGEAREDLQERRAMLRGGKFDRDLAISGMPANLDAEAREVHLLQAEGTFLRGRISALERRVIENRGTFARARDWMGNEEKNILDKAREDALEAATALSRAMTPDRGTTWQPGEEGTPLKPDVAAARKAVAELRRVDVRLTHAVGIYKEATKKAFEEFVDFVVMAATIVAGFGVTGIWVTAVRQAVATVGTKLLLKGNDYSVDEFLMDVGGGLANVGGDFAKLGVKHLVTPYVGSKILRFASRVGMSKAMIGKVRERLGPLAIRQAEYTFGTATANVLQGKGALEDQGLTARIKAEAQGQVVGSIEQAIIKRPAGGAAGGAKRGGAAAEEGGLAPRPDDEAAAVRRAGAEEESGGPIRRPADDDASARSAPHGGADSPAPRPSSAAAAATAEVDAEPVPRTSMALPEHPTPTPRSARSTAKPKPAAAEAESPRTPALAEPDAGPGPRPTGGATQGTGQVSVADAARTWTQPNTRGYRAAVTADADGNLTVHPNVEVHPGLVDADVGALLVELDRTPWGEKIANRIRDGEMKLVIMPSGPEFPFGGLAFAGGKVYIEWTPDIRRTASNAMHEGSHNVDPATMDSGKPRGPSTLGTEAEARAWEYEYNELVGLPPRQPSEVAYRAEFARIVNRTKGSKAITPDNPQGADLDRARREGDKAMLDAMRGDPGRYAVESIPQEEERIADRRNPDLVSDQIERMGWPEPAPVPDVLEIETMFGGQPTRPDVAAAPTRPRQGPDPADWQDSPRSGRSDRGRRRAQGTDESEPSPGGPAGGRGPRPTASAGQGSSGGATAPPTRAAVRVPYQAPPDPGLAGDRNRPNRRAVVLPEEMYAARDRSISRREDAEIARSQERVRRDIRQQLSRLPSGLDSGHDYERFTEAIEALRAEPDRGSNREILDHAETVWKAIHDPALIADVVSQVYGEARRRPGSSGLDPLTRAVLRLAAREGPVHVIPPKVDLGDNNFFEHWIATGRRFLDLDIDTAKHGHSTHLLQGLIVDAAFRRAGVKMTASRFRQLLGAAQTSRTDIGDPGNTLWVKMFDGIDGLPTPEVLLPALRKIPGLEKLR